MSGRFISFEGIDGCGKSTQAALLAAHFGALDGEVVLTREPGGTPVGERIREALLAGEGPTPLAEAHLFCAARAELVSAVIAPALARGATVICDRFIDSSLAYQGVARGLGLDAVLQLNAGALNGCLPWRTLLVELGLDEAAARRGDAADRIEREGDALQHAVARGYAEVLRRFPDRVVAVDGRGDPEQVHRRVIEALS